jgi:hypothetical protein
MRICLNISIRDMIINDWTIPLEVGSPCMQQKFFKIEALEDCLMNWKEDLWMYFMLYRLMDGIVLTQTSGFGSCTLYRHLIKKLVH